MHEPMIQAFRSRRFGITVWHVDPETDGSDDSCGWSLPKLTAAERAEATLLISDPEDNIRSFFAEPRDNDKIHDLMRTFRIFKRMQRPAWRHPRWHLHHWKIQIDVVVSFKRWAFSRCIGCGGRFAWGVCPVSHSWYSTGPRWFRNEAPGVYHADCSNTAVCASRAINA